MGEQLPQKITAMVKVTYDVPAIVADAREVEGQENKEFTLEEIMNWIEDYALEDLPERKPIYLNENGEQIWG